VRERAVTIVQQAFLLQSDADDCFCVYRAPADGSVVGTILHLPGFGDEMNKARPMTASAARAFANRGYAVLQVDLAGCGDSAGGHEDATFSRWLSNLHAADACLRRHCAAGAPSIFWCLRSGALLVGPLLETLRRQSIILLWQPVLSGTQQITLLLRQKIASDLGNSSTARVAARELRERWFAGETLEIGGYGISSQLAADVDTASFRLPHDVSQRVAWFEISTATGASLSPAARAKIDELRAAGNIVEAATVCGPGFWQSVEIERCDALVEVSINALENHRLALRRDTAVV
jgi:exosortase A-associated hydrolase 2